MHLLLGFLVTLAVKASMAEVVLAPDPSHAPKSRTNQNESVGDYRVDSTPNCNCSLSKTSDLEKAKCVLSLKITGEELESSLPNRNQTSNKILYDCDGTCLKMFRSNKAECGLHFFDRKDLESQLVPIPDGEPGAGMVSCRDPGLKEFIQKCGHGIVNKKNGLLSCKCGHSDILAPTYVKEGFTCKASLAEDGSAYWKMVESQTPLLVPSPYEGCPSGVTTVCNSIASECFNKSAKKSELMGKTFDYRIGCACLPPM